MERMISCYLGIKWLQQFRIFQIELKDIQILLEIERLKYIVNDPSSRKLRLEEHPTVSDETESNAKGKTIYETKAKNLTSQ